MERVKNLFRTMNEHGIYFPLLRDPVVRGPSLTFTFVVVAGLLWIVGIVGKWGADFSVNLEQAKEFFYATGMLYFSRTVVRATKSTITGQFVDQTGKSNDKKEQSPPQS